MLGFLGAYCDLERQLLQLAATSEVTPRGFLHRSSGSVRDETKGEMHNIIDGVVRVPLTDLSGQGAHGDATVVSAANPHIIPETICTVILLM